MGMCPMSAGGALGLASGDRCAPPPSRPPASPRAGRSLGLLAAIDLHGCELEGWSAAAASSTSSPAARLMLGLAAEIAVAHFSSARLARRGRVELGAAPDPSAADGLDLTEHERDVLRLVAAGRTNREIGAELYISPRTASVHVSRVLRTLGVRGRVEAAAFAHRRGLE